VLLLRIGISLNLAGEKTEINCKATVYIWVVLSIRYFMYVSASYYVRGTRSIGMTLLESPRLAWDSLLVGSILETGRGTGVLLDLRARGPMSERASAPTMEEELFVPSMLIVASKGGSSPEKTKKSST